MGRRLDQREGGGRISDAVIVALVSGGLTLLGTIITVVLSHKSTISTLEKNSELSDQKIRGEIAVINTKIENLAGEVRRHNDFATRVPVLEEKVKVANNRIDDLERGANHG